MAVSWAMEQLSLAEEGSGGDDTDFVLWFIGSDLCDLRHGQTP